MKRKAPRSIPFCLNVAAEAVHAARQTCNGQTTSEQTLDHVARALAVLQRARFLLRRRVREAADRCELGGSL